MFDSSGPEGKVRGTPSQVIEKYNQLARDAQLSNDRVAAENFQQHAEHYLRMLSEAQREQDQRREEQERVNRERQAERDRERAERQEREGNNQGGNQQNNNDQNDGNQKRSNQSGNADGGQQPASDPAETTLPDFIAEPAQQEADSGLVETPESKPKPKRAPRRKPKPKPEAESSDAAGKNNGDQPEAAE
ncbi:DUF4167 domain containing protein [Sulfitobacter noctilucae]|nr:DUF4167 domain containing protein [Sulfitobacter noctilucae]